MHIVVLDGYTLNPGDLSWAELERLGTMTVYDRTPPELVKERIQGADIVLTNKTPLTKEAFTGLNRLKYIGVLATGYNVVDVEAAAAQGICVTNVPKYGTDSVAQFVFALILELCHRVGQHGESVRSGGWAESPDFSYTLGRQIALAGKTIGIVGYGRIGKQVSRLAQAFGMRVLVAGREGRLPEAGEEGVERVPLEQLLAASDFVSLHCPLTPETEGLLNSVRIALMKPSAFLINTSRGGLLAERHVAEALNAGAIAGAALDVLTIEPPGKDNPLVHARNCIVTPHMAWATFEARSRLMDIAVGNVAAYLQGNARNEVNPA
ncbi:D-2-hydroxyacid dehydrogenase [Paenibacillus sp. GCM10023248]|uniref:D-2-hydroxyacid dehydrogenase n=1 Tax=Bacillales TaxID=1385 RepID=UPI00237868D3|nr:MULTISPECIES: D-2-hydroxyacid dehydrogenase [Bacillales]MDD9269368.1 D-2-hydroxyacid dehydrogenase [Paenibacillus sp. MAHUQ-63]MDR6881012.1 glycerate dehydrogenase [Bacillus sp. 3255]